MYFWVELHNAIYSAGYTVDDIEKITYKNVEIPTSDFWELLRLSFIAMGNKAYHGLTITMKDGYNLVKCFEFDTGRGYYKIVAEIPETKWLFKHGFGGIRNAPRNLHEVIDYINKEILELGVYKYEISDR